MALVVSSLGSTFNTTAGTKTVVATPAIGDLIVVITCNSGRTTAQSGTLSDNQGSGHASSYAQINSFTKKTSADSMWAYVRGDTIRAASSTTWTFTPTATDTGGGLQVFKITGMSVAGLAAIRQSAIVSNQASGSAPAPALDVVALTGNALIGAMMNATSPAGMTQPTGFTESVDTGWSTPTEGVETCFASSGITASTITWGSSSASAFGALVLELDATAAVPGKPDAEEFGAPYHDRNARNRSAVW